MRPLILAGSSLVWLAGCLFSIQSAVADPQATLPEDVTPGLSADKECHGLIGRRGPGNYSIYGNGPRVNDPRWINYMIFWINDADDPNGFDPARHLVRDGSYWRASPDAPPSKVFVYVDPCNRNYTNPIGCKDLEGSATASYAPGAPLTWMDPDGNLQTLVDEPINNYLYPSYAGVTDRHNPLHFYRTGFRPAASAFCTIHLGNQVSPLVLDLTGAGLKFTTPEQIVRFDFGQTGGATSWIANPESAAFVALDLNGNAAIDSGHELFGNTTAGPDAKIAADGFLALAKHDANGDRLINSRDEIFSKLLLWQDRNLNGRTDSGELRPAKELVVSIGLEYDSQMYFKDAHDNHALGRAAVSLVKGEKAWLYDAWFTAGKDLLTMKPPGFLGHPPEEGTKEQQRVSQDLAALLKEDGWEENDAVYSRGVQYTKKDESKQVSEYTLRWTMGEKQECFAQLIYDPAWNLKDRVVNCE